MNINSLIVTALTPLGIPIKTQSYSVETKQKPDQYFVFFTYSDRPGGFASGNITREDIRGQVSLFSKINYKALAESAVVALRAAGFKAWLSSETYETDTHYYHQAIEFSYFYDHYQSGGG